MDPAEGHTGLAQEMDEIDLDVCNCNYLKEYNDVLECFKECGENSHTTTEQILTRMKAAEKPAHLLESFMFSRGK